MKERDILAAVKDYLNAKGYCWWRMPLGPVMQNGGKFAKNPLKGFPDLCGILKSKKGVFFACELKQKKGITSLSQGNWLEKLAAAGVYAFVARSVDEFISKLEESENDTR